MSRTVDERIVQMEFDNAKFESNVNTSLKTIDKLKNALNFTGAGKGLERLGNIDMRATADGIELCAKGFSGLGAIGLQVLQRITNKAMVMGESLARALTVAPLTDGLQEYETQINSVQTILANTRSKGTTIDDVNKALDELNTYADKTIYNFSQMTRNVGTFTAAGLGLETSTKAIKGIANLAAVSGSSSQQASVAMYQLSQALATGTVKLQDWNSVVNAGMGGEVFQEALKRTARVLGTGVDAAIEKYGTFRESLTRGEWLTTEVLSETLNQIAGAYTEADLQAKGYNAEQIAQILDLAKTAEDAATKVKTFTQLIDTLKEALGSGWAQTWRTVIGDFEQARALWTSVSDVLGNMINESSNARNAVLQEWADFGGRQSVILGLKAGFEALTAVLEPVKEAFSTIFPPITAKTLLSITSSFRIFMQLLKPTADQLWVIRGIFQGAFGLIKIAVEGLVNLGKTLSGAAKKALEFTGAFDILSKAFNVIGTFGYLISDIARFGVESATVSDKILRLAKTVPAFGVAIDVVSTAVSVLRLAFTAVSVAAQKAWAVISPLGSKIAGIFNKNDGGAGASKISKALETIRNAADGLTASLTKANDTVTESAKTVSSKFEPVLAIVESAIHFIGQAFDKILSFASTIAGKIRTVVGNIADAFSSAFEKSNAANGGFGFASIVAGFAGAFAIISKVMAPAINFIGILKSMKDELLGSGSVFDKVKRSLDAGIEGLKSLQKVLVDYQKSIQVKMIKDVAVAVAILAGSLVVLSMVKPEKLLAGIGAMAALMVMLNKSFVPLLKVTRAFNSFNAKSIVKTIVALNGFASAILLLSVAVRIMSSADPERTAVGIVGLGAAMFGMVGALKLMEKLQFQSLASSIGSLISFATAMLILSFAVRSLSKLNLKELGKGLGGVAGLLVGLGVFLRVINGSNLGIKTAAGILLLSTSIVILTSAVKTLAALKPESMIQGLVGFYGVLLGIYGFDKMMEKSSTNMLKARASILLLAMAMKTLAGALQIFVGLVGSGSAEDLIKYGLGIAGFVVTLMAVSGALFALGKAGETVKVGATSLVVASAGILMLSYALQQISQINNIKDTLIVLGASLGELAAGLFLMNKSISGAGALAIAATGLALLAPALSTISKLNLTATAIGLGLIMVALLAMTGIGTLAAPVTPVILGLTAALVALSLAAGIISVSILALSASFLLFQQAIVGFATMGTALATKAVETIKILFTGLLQIVASLADEFVNTLTVITQALLTYLPIFGQFITAFGATILASINSNLPMFFTVVENFITNLLKLISDKAPQYLETLGVVISALLALLTEKIPEFVVAGTNIVIGILNGLSANAQQLITAGLNLIYTLMDGISTGIPNLVNKAFECAIAFMNGIGNAFRENGPAVGEAARNMFAGIIAGIVSAIVPGGADILKAFTDAIDNVLTTLGKYVTKFVDIGQKFVQGLVDGLGKIKDKVSTAAHKLGEAVIGASAKALDEKSPSRAAEQQGVYYGEGLEHGIDKKTKDVSDSAFKMGRAAIDSMNEALDEHSKSKEGVKSGEYLDEGVGAGIDNKSDVPANAAKDMASNVVETVSNGLSDLKDTVTKPMSETADSVKSSTDSINKSNSKYAENFTRTGRIIREDSNYTYEEVTQTVNGVTSTYEHAFPKIKEQQDTAVVNEEVAATKSTKTKKEYEKADHEFWQNLLTVREQASGNIQSQYEDIADFEKDILSKTSDIIDNYTTKLDDSAREMADKDLFKKVSEKSEVSAQELMENLKGQIEQIEEYTNVMNSLNTRISSTALREVISEMGVESLGELEALNSMTDEQLTEYTNLYDQKYSASLAQLKTKAQNELSNLYNGIPINIDAFAATFDGSLASIEAYFKNPDIQSKTAKIGANITEGVAKGINDADALKAMDDGSVKLQEHTTQKSLPTAFDSHSPAKKTIPEGVKITQGVAKGMYNKQAYASIDSATRTLMLYVLKSLDTAYNTAKIKDKATSIGKSISDAISRGIAKASNKETGEKNGKSYAKSLANGMKSMSSVVSSASDTISESSLSGFQSAVSLLSDMDDFDTSPVITPVMDLSDIQNGVYSINDLMSGADAYNIAADISDTLNAKKLAKANDILAMQRAMNSINSSNSVRSDEIADLQKTVQELSSAISSMSRGNSLSVSPTFNIQSNDPKAVADEVNIALQRMIDRNSAIWA